MGVLKCKKDKALILISSSAFLQLVPVLVFLNSCLNDQMECYLKGVTFRVRAFCEMNKLSE